jgi:hypothetical protein
MHTTNRLRASALGVIAAGIAWAIGCGGSAKLDATAKLPGGAAPTSGEGSLMAGTFAGQNKCNPKNHERPFIIEWDGTDIASFEARANTDIVFVHYEGCDLKIVEGCTNDAVKGSFGSYKSIDWTSGTIDRVDIKNEEELFAKLPLGVANFGGRVKRGEQLHMEYFVSGVRSATRDAVYRKDLISVPACAKATHFVYGYNLGAFSLAAGAKFDGAAAASLASSGIEGRKQFEKTADKNGGLISSCRSESAKDIQTCKLPIRLTLRPIEEGENPEASAARVPETPAAKGVASQLKATTDRERKAEEYVRTAEERFNARDGRACLAALDEHDKLDPRPIGMSTSPRGYTSMRRAQCLMAAGQCPAGRDLLRRYMEANNGSNLGPEQRDSFVDHWAGELCRGAALSPRDKLLSASATLKRGQQQRVPLSDCVEVQRQGRVRQRHCPLAQQRRERSLYLFSKSRRLHGGLARKA